MAGDALERLDDLLLRQATEGLDAAEASELDGLLAGHESADARGYELAAAAVCLAVYGSRGALPSAVRARLERSAADLAPGASANDE